MPGRVSAEEHSRHTRSLSRSRWRSNLDRYERSPFHHLLFYPVVVQQCSLWRCEISVRLRTCTDGVSSKCRAPLRINSIMPCSVPESMPATEHISETHPKLTAARRARERGGSSGKFDISRPSSVAFPSVAKKNALSSAKMVRDRSLS